MLYHRGKKKLKQSVLFSQPTFVLWKALLKKLFADRHLLPQNTRQITGKFLHLRCLNKHFYRIKKKHAMPSDLAAGIFWPQRRYGKNKAILLLLGFSRRSHIRKGRQILKSGTLTHKPPTCMTETCIYPHTCIL